MKIYKITEASEYLGVSINTLKTLANNGKINSFKTSGKHRRFRQDDLDAYMGVEKEKQEKLTVIYARCSSEYAVSEYYDKNSCGLAEDQAIYGENSHSKKKPIALSFFSGAMGLDLGLEQAGFEVVLCSEIDNACRKTIRKNRPDIALVGDIRNYTPSEILKHANLDKNDDIDLIAGGPPCQAFSTAGKRKSFEDERGNVFLTYIDLILKLRPRYAVIENVRGILSAPLKHRPHAYRGNGKPPLSPEERKGGALFHIINKLKKGGYSVSFNLYNSANFGTPQKRERVVIICSRDGNKLPYLVPTHSEKGDFGLEKWKTFREATKELKKTKHNHLEFPEKRLKYYRMLKPGQYWRSLPVDLQKEALGKSFHAGGGKTGFLRRLAWNAPSPTLVTHPAIPATDLAHPIENRPLSVEEYKKIQEFPDDWQVEGSMVEQYRQLGNAVPISLGKAVGNLLISHMKNQKVKTVLNFPYSRYRNTDDVTWMNKFTTSIQLEKNRLNLVEFKKEVLK